VSTIPSQSAGFDVPPVQAPARSGLRYSVLALAAVTCMLAGCANYFGIKSDKQIASTSQFESTQTLPGQGGQWPTLAWLDQFGDPQLRALINEAIANNPSIEQANARLAKASSYIETARSGLMPKVNASYSWNRELYSSNALYPTPYGGNWYSENNVLASASWDLDLWGKNRNKLSSAVSQKNAAAADLYVARLSLGASVARTYNQLAELYAMRDIAQRETAERQAIGKLTDSRVKAGLDSHTEQQSALGNIASSQSSVADYDGQIATVRFQLAALLGKGPDRALQIQEPTMRAPNDLLLPNNLPADLVARRPDIVAARWQVEAAMHDVKEAKAEFFPDVNLAAGFGFDAFGWSDFLKFTSRQAQFGPAIHLPIFDAGALRSQLKGRYADFDLAVANYDQTLVNALNDVATQVAAVQALDRQLSDAQHALDASNRAYELAKIRYGAGLAPQLQVLSADTARLEAERSVTSLQINRRDLEIRLMTALGGGFDAQAHGLAFDAPASAPAAPASVAKAPGVNPPPASNSVTNATVAVRNQTQLTQ
jgi:NodT family efflux transporter outer membrane factor (OMF) lipoprotein